MEADQTYARGDTWLVDFGPHPEDPEQAWARPALIVSADNLHRPRLRMIVVVPGTSTIRDLPLHIVAEPDVTNGLDRSTAFQVEQVRAVSTARLKERLGRLDAESRHAVDEVLRMVLSLN